MKKKKTVRIKYTCTLLVSTNNKQVHINTWMYFWRFGMEDKTLKVCSLSLKFPRNWCQNSYVIDHSVVLHDCHQDFKLPCKQHLGIVDVFFVYFPLEVTYRQEVKFRVAWGTVLYYSLTKFIPVSLMAKLDTIHMILKDKIVKKCQN